MFRFSTYLTCITGENWPYFDSNPSTANNAMWDSTPPRGNDPWPAASSSPPNRGIWPPNLASSSPPGAPGQGWGGVSSIWGSPTTIHAADTNGSVIGDGKPGEAAVVRPQSASGGASGGAHDYDPFNNMWNPAGFGVAGQNNWASFSPPKPDEN